MLSFFSLLMNISIIWTGNTIQIPVGESLENYKSIPEAHLYMDDKLVEDKYMYYEYEINFTSFSVIRTHVIGTYTVWYRAHFPTLGFESDAAITFIVYDHIKPTITGQKDVYVDVGTKQIDYKGLVSYSDNYDPTKDLTLTIYSAQVNLNQIGTYQVSYHVKDKANNETTWIQNIHVVDHVKPVVKQKMQVEINIGEAIDLDKYFTFTDNYDQTLDIRLDDQHINYQLPNTYPATLYVTDQSGNRVTLNFNVNIKDTSAPRIVLKTNKIQVNYLSNISKETLKTYIMAVEDNIDDLSIDDVRITSYIDTSYLGSYEVVYKITDSNQLEGEAKLIVEVQDLEAPSVTLKQEIVVDVGSLEPYVFDYVEIKDNYNEFADLTITKSGSITMSKIGSYRIIIKVQDKAKNTTEFPVIVEVVDRIAPSLEVPSDYEVTNFLKPDYEKLIQVSDNYDGSPQIIIDDDHVLYDKVGSYEVYISAKDSSNNITSKKIVVEIKDLSYPEIILTTHQVYIPYGTDSINYLVYIQEIIDSYDKDLKIEDVVIASTLDFNKVGLYQVTYSIKDKSGNEGKALLYVFLQDYEKPVIEVSPMTIKVGSHFNYLSYVSAYDNYDGNISHLVKMNPSFIPLHEPGYYEVIFYVHDASGNYAETKVLLTVLENNDVLDYIYYIGIGAVLIIGVVVYYIYKKKHENI